MANCCGIHTTQQWSRDRQKRLMTTRWKPVRTNKRDVDMISILCQTHGIIEA